MIWFHFTWRLPAIVVAQRSKSYWCRCRAFRKWMPDYCCACYDTVYTCCCLPPALLFSALARLFTEDGIFLMLIRFRTGPLWPSTIFVSLAWLTPSFYDT